MPTYIAQLGNTPELSYSELVAVLPEYTITQTDEVAHLQPPEGVVLDPQALMNSLGGTVKLFEVLTELSDTSEDALEEILAAKLEDTARQSDAHKVQFAIAELGRNHLPTLDETAIKQRLKERGIAARYRTDSRRGLSASILLHNRVEELAIIQLAQKTYLAQTVAVQDIDEWTKRDRSKPYADKRKGMLPPKVARIMVNLAQKQSVDTTNTTAKKEGTLPVLLDPFCGTGTVLIEALLAGYSVIGSDNDQPAVTGAQENVAWAIDAYNMPEAQTKVVYADARTLKSPNQMVDCIVSEPLLGKPRPTTQQAPKIITQLEKLYYKAFDNWRSFLVPGATIVIVFPEIVTESKTYTLEGLIDRLANLRYTTSSEPIMYYREHAIVQRAIHQFVFQPNE